MMLVYLRAEITLTSNLSHSLGDILGFAMQNIQNLLQMPYGCGVQNMVVFVPNIFVLNYLNETQQLTPEIKSKALGYLISGETKVYFVILRLFPIKLELYFQILS